jgi:nitroreductase
LNQASAQTFEAILTSRHSCRAFLAEPLDDDVVERLLRAAQRTPSWCNTQPWQLHVTRGAATDRFRSALLAHVDAEDGLGSSDFAQPAGYSGVRRTRRRESGWALYESVGVGRGDRGASARQTRENYALFGAPHVAIVSSPAELGTYGAVDCGLWVATFLYAAESLGVGAIAQAALAMHSPFVREYFGIDDDYLILCGISFGWPDQHHAANGFRTSRASIGDDVVHWVDPVQPD